ncbi:MAG TPA: hypothetical protein VNO50_02995 [Pyrinomonadaceae bacterium]|nr:hypothetical protein [Pyrinomonadaceae bacterium]
MRNSKHGLKALVLTVMAALGMMAFFAVGAQAQHELHLLVLADETNPNPLTNGGTLGDYLINLAAALLATLTGFQENPGYLLVAARDLKIECATGDVNSAKIHGLTDALATVTFLNCVANNHKGEPLAGCQFKELKTIKASALVLPVSHGGQSYLLFEPLEGEIFTTVSFKPNVGCILPLNNPVKGAVVAKVDALDADVQTILFNSAIQLLLGDVLKYGSLSNTSYVNGHATVELDGEHAPYKLGVH